MTWKPVPELFELVTWADITEGDHVWSMGGVCVITRGAFCYTDDDYDRALLSEFARFGHRDESGNEYAPPMELAARVPRLIPPGRGTAENDARTAIQHDIYGFQQDMLHRGEDITDNAVWKPAQREFLHWLVHLAYRELHRSAAYQEKTP